MKCFTDWIPLNKVLRSNLICLIFSLIGKIVYSSYNVIPLEGEFVTFLNLQMLFTLGCE